MSTMTIFSWLEKYNYGGFSVEKKRVERGQDIARDMNSHFRLPNRGAAETGVNKTIRSYAVEWNIAPDTSANSALVTPSCTCADWLQSGGWTEKRLCKHLLALAMMSDIPAFFGPLSPQAHTAQKAAGSSTPQTPAAEGFPSKVSSAIAHAISSLGNTIWEIVQGQRVPFLIGPTGCGKTSAHRMLAVQNQLGLVEHAGSDAWTDSDLVGVIHPNGTPMPGPVAQAFWRARESDEKVLLLLDEFTRNNRRTQESLMRMLQVTPADVAHALGIQSEGGIRITSAPFWGSEWAPADKVFVSLACNPWGTEIDPALLRRTEPIRVDFDSKVAALFSERVKSAIEASWNAVRNGELALPVEYQALSNTGGPDDLALVADYVRRLAILDPAGADGFVSNLEGLGNIRRADLEAALPSHVGGLGLLQPVAV